MNKKTRLALIFTGIGLLIVAGLCALLWCIITGYDLLAWFTSETAFIVYFLIVIYFGFVGWVFLKYGR